MAVRSGWQLHEAGLVLDAGRAASLRRRVEQWSRCRGGRFSADDESTVTIWSGGRAVEQAIPIAAFTLRDAGPQTIVDYLYWDPAHARVEIVWRALGLLIGRAGATARPEPPTLA